MLYLRIEIKTKINNLKLVNCLIHPEFNYLNRNSNSISLITENNSYINNMRQKIKSTTDLIKIKEEVQTKIRKWEDSSNSGQMVQIKVGMATCGIASGAKEIMNFFIEETDHQAIDAVVTQTGCLGYCYAEPTVEVILPGKKPVVFGFVNKKKAEEIIDIFINQGEPVDSVLPLNYRTIDE
jgi:NADP-reducing hydrogenase subunit HndB